MCIQRRGACGKRRLSVSRELLNNATSISEVTQETDLQLPENSALVARECELQSGVQPFRSASVMTHPHRQGDWTQTHHGNILLAVAMRLFLESFCRAKNIFPEYGVGSHRLGSQTE